MAKKPRSRWPLLFALLFGAGTWWGIGWWLSPRAYWEGWYANPKPKPDGSLTHYSDVNLHASILDRTGRYLIIEKSGPSLFESYEVIDLLDSSFTRHQCIQSNTGMRYVGRRQHLTDANGNIFMAYQTSAARQPTYNEDGTLIPYPEEMKLLSVRPEQDSNPDTVFTLWHWNVLTNQSSLLRQYPHSTIVKVSEDGSTLLEIERVTPMLPSLLQSMNLPGCVTGQAEASLGCADLAEMKIWSLPEMRLRSTIAFPWMYRQNNAELTRDGAYLILTDSPNTTGFTSPCFEYHRLDEQVRISRLPKYFMSMPKGIRVYDTRTGALYWEKLGYEDNYSINPHRQKSKDVLQFSSTESSSQNKFLSLHLPSRSERISQFCFSANWLNDQCLQSIHGEILNSKQATFALQGTAPDGSTSVIKHIQMGNLAVGFSEPCLIAHAPQLVVERLHLKSDMLPAWLNKFLADANWLDAWRRDVHQELCVEDYEHSRTLCTWFGSASAKLDYSMTDHWLVVSQNDDEHFHVAVYALPLPSWSAWWARWAGIVVMLLCWLAFKHRHVK